MDKIQSSRVYSLIKSDDVLDDHAAEVATVTAIPPMAAALKALILSIMDTASKGEKDTSGITTDKEIKKEALIKQVKDVARGTAPVLKSLNDLDNLVAVTFTDSYFYNILDDKLYRVAGEVYTIANAHVAALIGVTPMQVASLLAQKDEFLDVMRDPKRAIEIRKVHNAKLNPQIDEGVKLREEIDIYMQTFIATNPDLYYEWKFSLSIDDISGNAQPDLIQTVAVPANGVVNVPFDDIALVGSTQIKLLNFSAGDLEHGFGSDGASIDAPLVAAANSQKRQTASALGFNALTATQYNIRNNNAVDLNCKVEFYVMD